MKFKTRKITSLALAITIFTSCFAVHGAEVSNLSDKIDAELKAVIEQTTGDAKIPVMIWLNEDEEATTESVVEAEYAELTKAEKQTALKALAANADAEVPEDPVQQEIELKRDLSSQVYTQNNSEAVDTLFPKSESALFGLLTVENSQPEIEYISQYSPVILANMTVDQISAIANSEQVDTLYYNPPIEPIEEENITTEENSVMATSEEVRTKTISDAFKAMNIPYVRDTIGLDGYNVKIGMLETYCPNTTEPSLQNAQIDCHGMQEGKESDYHATKVAETLVANGGGYKGIVPSAKLYSRTISSNTWHIELEALLGNGVNIINMSTSIDLVYADKYNAVARWLDHVAIQHDVHVVVAVANKKDSPNMPVNKIGKPAFGNNIIAVGAMNIEASNESGWYVEDFSCRLDKANQGTQPYKPDVVAPGMTYRSISDVATSFSTPMVVGMIAQLCELNSSLKTKQDVVKSIILNSAVHVPVKETGTAIAMREKRGAGMVDAKAAHYIANNNRYKGVTLASGTNTYTTSFNVTASDTLTRVALSWLRNSKTATSDHDANTDTNNAALARLTLKVTAPNGTTWTSNHPMGSVQLVSFKPPVTGKYTITVTRTTQKTSTTYFGVSWY